MNNATPFTPGYVKENLVRVSDPSQSYCDRVKGRQILLDNPEREGRARKERIAKRNERTPSRALVGVIGIREVKQKGLWKLSAAEIKFDRFLPLHYLWMDYMSELLNLPPPPSVPGPSVDDTPLPGGSSMHAKLVKADLHGSILSVRQSRNPCLVGLSGIVIHETENAFKIVTKNNHLKLVPKSHSIFVLSLPLFSYVASRHGVEPAGSTITIDSQDITSSTSAKTRKNVLDLPHVELELYGNQFCFRASDRASKKFKSKETIEL